MISLSKVLDFIPTVLSEKDRKDMEVALIRLYGTSGLDDDVQTVLTLMDQAHEDYNDKVWGLQDEVETKQDEIEELEDKISNLEELIANMSE